MTTKISKAITLKNITSKNFDVYENFHSACMLGRNWTIICILDRRIFETMKDFKNHFKHTHIEKEEVRHG